MSYRFKGQKVIIEGVENIIVPTSLPGSPEDGYLAVDSSDGKLKVYNETKARWVVLGDAEDIVFNNTSNGYTATEVQSAIEESFNSAILKPRFSIVTTFNGTTGNEYLGYSELIPGDKTPIRIPLNSVLKEITVAYRDTLLGSASIDGTYRLYKNGLSNPGDVVHTEVFSNQNNGKLITGLNISFNANDYMVGQWVDQGSNPKDMVIVYFFQVQ